MKILKIYIVTVAGYLAGYPAIWSIRYPARYWAIKSGIRPDAGSLERPDYPTGYPANRISSAFLLAKIAFLVLIKLRIHYIRSEIFFSLKIGQYRYQKIHIFTVISKMLTFLSNKKHPKKVTTKNFLKKITIPQKSVFCQ
jgi:hypothetical protein